MFKFHLIAIITHVFNILNNSVRVCYAFQYYIKYPKLYKFFTGEFLFTSDNSVNIFLYFKTSRINI